MCVPCLFVSFLWRCEYDLTRMVIDAIYDSRNREHATYDREYRCDEGTEGDALLRDAHHEGTQIVNEED